jgi:sugar lactone lactonase YvrE
MAPRVTKLDVPLSVLGESPIWSERDACLYFVDILANSVQSYSPSSGKYQKWTFDTYVGSLAECRSGGLILSLGDRVVRFDPARGERSVEDFVVLERDRPQNRLNDGKVDPWGRFWVGSVQRAENAPEARLWCVSPSGEARVMREGITVSNGLAFDAGRERLYFADSPTGLIEQASLGKSGTLSAFSPFARAGKGSPDGSCTDTESYLWNAEWGGHRLCRYTPDGALDRVVEMPVSRPSSCAFGGSDYRTLFVTSAQAGMSAEELEKEPDAGALFAVELLDAQGLPADLFGI